MSNIAEIFESADGMPVVGLTATATKAWPAREVKTKNGPTTVMDLELTDQTGSIKGVWWSPPFPNTAILNKALTISAAKNQKNQLTGVTKGTRNDKNGNPRPEVIISGTHANLAGAAAPAVQPTTTARPATQAQPAQSRAVNPMPGTVTLTKYMSLGLIAYKFARDVMGVQEEQACMAFVSTIGIALTNGKLAIDSDRDLLEFQEDHWPDDVRIVPIPEDEPPSDHDDGAPDPTDDDIPF